MYTPIDPQSTENAPAQAGATPSIADAVNDFMETLRENPEQFGKPGQEWHDPAIPGAHIKSVTVKYTRKLNPELLDPARKYEGLEEECFLHAEIDEGADEVACIEALQILCEERVAERLAEKARRLRDLARSPAKYSPLAVEASYRQILVQSGVIDEAEQDQSWATFKAALDLAAANMAGQ